VLTCSISTGRFSDGDVVKLRMGERVDLAAAREKVLNIDESGGDGGSVYDGCCRLMQAYGYLGTQASNLRVEDKVTTLVETHSLQIVSAVLSTRTISSC
jgi:hypothetical protein